MKNINDYLNLNEDIGRIYNDEETPLDGNVDNAINVITDYFKSNCESKYSDKRKITSLTYQILSALDNKFTGQDAYLGEMIFKAINTYVNK